MRRCKPGQINFSLMLPEPMYRRLQQLAIAESRRRSTGKVHASAIIRRAIEKYLTGVYDWGNDDASSINSRTSPAASTKADGEPRTRLHRRGS